MGPLYGVQSFKNRLIWSPHSPQVSICAASFRPYLPVLSIASLSELHCSDLLQCDSLHGLQGSLHSSAWSATFILAHSCSQCTLEIFTLFLNFITEMSPVWLTVPALGSLLSQIPGVCSEVDFERTVYIYSLLL